MDKIEDLDHPGVSSIKYKIGHTRVFLRLLGICVFTCGKFQESGKAFAINTYTVVDPPFRALLFMEAYQKRHTHGAEQK